VIVLIMACFVGLPATHMRLTTSVVSAAGALICQAIYTSEIAVCNYLKQQESLGLAAGNAGDYYLNSDSGHAALNTAFYHPQVTNLPQTFGSVSGSDPTRVIVGNSSVCQYEGNNCFSATRTNFFNTQAGANAVYNQYRANNAFWYPEHADHDAIDEYHGMMATVNNSQGSSGSEIDEVQNFFWALAAFRPQTKARLKSEGLLMPTLQMLMRRSRGRSDAAYLSGQPHTNAYDGDDIALTMAQMANAILPDQIPPMVRLQVVSDTYTGQPTKDFFDTVNSERIYDTPVSIARIWKSFRSTQTIQVSAASSYDANARPLTYHWVVLRGDPARVRITPLNAEKSEVRIDLDYLTTETIQVPRGGDPNIQTNLVVVGAFVHNGFYYSAPAFVTSYTLPNETRVYDTNGRLERISYAYRPTLRAVSYLKRWQEDLFFYNAAGSLTGWTRTKNFVTTDFVPEGYQVISRNGPGQVQTVQRVNYTSTLENGDVYVDWQLTGTPFSYGPTDTQSPSTPSNAGLSTTSSNSLQFFWNAATDNVGVTGYRVDVSTDPTFSSFVGAYRDFNVLTTSVLISGLSPSTTYYAHVRAYDAAQNISGYSGTAFGTTSPPLPAITSAQSAAGTVDSAFGYQIVATNNPTSFNATGLPAGLSINTVTGLISGTPATAGSANVTMSATNASGTGSAILSVTINPPSSGGSEVPFIVSKTTGYLRNDITGWFGMQVQVGNSPLTVTSLGRIVVSGNSQSHTLKLIRASNGQEVGSISLIPSGTPGEYSYAPLGSPVTLLANTLYYLVSSEVAGGDYWHHWDATVTPGPVGTVPGAVYSSPNIYWIAASAPGNSYGTLNFKYQIAGSLPPPPTSEASFIVSKTSGSLRNNATGWFGMQVQVGTSPLTVTSLGRLFVAGNSQSHTLKLVRASDWQEVASVIWTPGGTPGEYSYAPLGSPVTVSANTLYYLVNSEVAGGDYWHHWDATVTPAPVGTVPGAAYSGPSIYWITASAPGNGYGTLSFKYRVGQF